MWRRVWSGETRYSPRKYFLGSPGVRIYNIPFKIHALFNKALRVPRLVSARARVHLRKLISAVI